MGVAQQTPTTLVAGLRGEDAGHQTGRVLTLVCLQHLAHFTLSLGISAQST